MKHLYMLKKEGKTVGYCKWNECGYWGWSEWGEKNTWFGGDNARISHDSIHPYVTDDKNGKPVFEGDRVKGVYDVSRVYEEVEGLVVTDGTNEDNMPVGPYIEDDEGNQYPLEDMHDIELIEDPENEL